MGRSHLEGLHVAKSTESYAKYSCIAGTFFYDSLRGPRTDIMISVFSEFFRL